MAIGVLYVPFVVVTISGPLFDIGQDR